MQSDFGRSLIVTLELSGERQGQFQKVGYGNCPDWSPDGKQVTFFVNGGNADQDARGVWIANRDGTGRQLLGANLWNPRWSPDGTQILCCTSFSAPKEYMLINVATGESRKILSEVQGLGVPDWAPDGKHVCLTRLVDNERRLSLIGLGGNENSGDRNTIADLWKSRLQVPDVGYYDNSRPCISSDGREVLFADNSTGNSILRRVAIDGKSENRMIAPALARADVNAVWSPDRKRIVLVSTQPPTEIPGLKLRRERKQDAVSGAPRGK